MAAEWKTDVDDFVWLLLLLLFSIAFAFQFLLFSSVFRSFCAMIAFEKAMNSKNFLLAILMLFEYNVCVCACVR